MSGPHFKTRLHHFKMRLPICTQAIPQWAMWLRECSNRWVEQQSCNRMVDWCYHLHCPLLCSPCRWSPPQPGLSHPPRMQPISLPLPLCQSLQSKILCHPPPKWWLPLPPQICLILQPLPVHLQVSQLAVLSLSPQPPPSFLLLHHPPHPLWGVQPPPSLSLQHPLLKAHPPSLI